MNPNHDAIIEIIRNQELGCVDLGKAIDLLCRNAVPQTRIVAQSKLSKPAISHLLKCFLNLRGLAFRMCHSCKMNADACYLLARNTGIDQDRAMERAIEISQRREGSRTVQKLGFKGRRTLKGQVTRPDMEEAIRDVKYGIGKA